MLWPKPEAAAYLVIKISKKPDQKLGMWVKPDKPKNY
jgi:hypothetical protein